MLQILDTASGIEMFDAVLGSTLRPSNVLMEAAKFVTGNECRDTDAKKLLLTKIPHHVKVKGSKVGTYILQGQGRGIDVVRAAFVGFVTIEFLLIYHLSDY